MSAVASAMPRLRLLQELDRRSPELTRLAFAFLALGVACIALQAVDGRTLDGVNVWTKPAKFFVSIAVFALTHAWFFGLVDPRRRTAAPLRAVVWTTIGASVFEMAYIVAQAARGVHSHFNLATPFEAAMYGLMGIFAVALVATTLPLAFEVARNPAPGVRPDMRAAVVAGLVLTFVLGGLMSFRMASGTGHAVGAVGGHFPIFGWNREGGDLRVPHFFGMHLEQALPLLAAAAAPLAPARRWVLLGVGTIAAVAITLATYQQAIAGRPFLPWIG